MISTFKNKLYFNIFHYYSLIQKWFKLRIYQPIDNFIDSYSDQELSKGQWTQVYHLTVSRCITNRLLEELFYDSEKYILLEDEEQNLSEPFNRFINIPFTNSRFNHDTKQFPHIFERLIVAKKDEKILCRRFSYSQERLCNAPLNRITEKSNIEFIIVEYVHPSAQTNITLEIPKAYYMVDNELFSPAFVYRMLEMKKEYFIFDMDYKIVFIDHSFEKKILTGNQYIQLNTNSYTIKEIFSTEID